MSNEYISTIRKQNIYGSAEFNMPSRPMTKEEIEKGKTSDWFRVQLTGYLRTLPIKICSHTFITTLVIRDNLFNSLPQEICRLENLKNLDASNNNISLLPIQMGYMFQLRNILLCNNRIKDVPCTFGFLHNVIMLDLRNNPLVNHTAQLYEMEISGKNLIRYLLEQFYNKNKINAPPNRHWHIIEKPTDGMSFTLMSYNVLCQKYATSNLYPYCPSFALDWEYRKRGILEEIFKYKADIICLQELETSQYENVFYLELRKRNYDGLFIPKSRSRTMRENESKLVDGCAIFWKIDCFEKVHHVSHEFMFSCIGTSKNPAPELINRVMVRDNVALSIILEVKDPKMNKRKLCVSTGHIHWDPEHSDVKLVQTLFWLSELWNYIRNYHQSINMPNQSPTEMPVILCGDLNSLPDSGVVDFLINGDVECNHVDFKDYGDKYMFNEWDVVRDGFFDNDVLRHQFNFDRAYKDEDDSDLKWTNYTYDFKGIIDYVFFSKDHLNLLGNLKQIPETWFEQQMIIGAPHVHFNSDHFSLLVEFEMKITPTKETVHSKISNKRKSDLVIQAHSETIHNLPDLSNSSSITFSSVLSNIHDSGPSSYHHYQSQSTAWS